MQSIVIKSVVAVLLFVAGIGLAVATRTTWTEWLTPTKEDGARKKAADGVERVTLSVQAQKNLRLIVRQSALTTYERKIYLPGTVVDKPGHSDRGVPAPIAGVIVSVNAVPGKSLRTGDELFRLRVVSESFQTSQMELFKNTRELEIAQKEYKRLKAVQEAIPPSKLLELEYQQDRLKVLIHAHQQDLRIRQLTAAQIADIEKGDFVTEVGIRMPSRIGKHRYGGDPLPVPAIGPEASADARLPVPTPAPVEYEVQELKVNLGDYVQAGQMLAYLADHRFLYIEGRALKHEAQVLAQAAQKGWPVEAEFNEDDDLAPGERLTNLRIEFLGNTMDASGLTLPVYVPFANPHRDHERSGTYRPGQKVLLKVTVATLADVFVLPQAAVVREGAEAYVFRQNGDAFDRRPVHVLHEDSDSVVIAYDGKITPGNYIAHNAAAALNRALKASQAEGAGGHHHDHDH